MKQTIVKQNGNGKPRCNPANKPVSFVGYIGDFGHYLRNIGASHGACMGSPDRHRIIPPSSRKLRSPWVPPCQQTDNRSLCEAKAGRGQSLWLHQICCVLALLVPSAER